MIEIYSLIVFVLINLIILCIAIQAVLLAIVLSAGPIYGFANVLFSRASFKSMYYTMKHIRSEMPR